MNQKNLIRVVIVLGILLAGCSTTKVTTEMLSTQTAKHFSKTIAKEVALDYLLYLPSDYGQNGKKFPLVLFLHGSGERGSDVNIVKKHGPPSLVEKGQKFPFILVSPQCPAGERWSAETLGPLLDDIESNYNVDASRIYITGLSMGGFGTWDLASAYPDRFAALIPICGGGNVNTVCTLKNIPIWAFHGRKDDVVPFEQSEMLVNALKACGSNVKFTAYPEAKHDSWTITYDNPEVFEWMLSQSLKQ